MAYYFKYNCPNTTEEANLPRSKNTVTFYFCYAGSSSVIKDYIVEYSGEDPVCLDTLRGDADMAEVTLEDYNNAKLDAKYKKTKNKGE